MTVWKAGMKITADRLNAGTAAGQVTVSPTTTRSFPSGITGSYKYGNATVTFPTGTFDSAPTVVCVANTSVPGIVLECSASSVTATGFTANLARLDTTDTVVLWFAKEQTQ